MEKSDEFSMAEAFLQKLTNAVFANLNNDQFGAEDLAKEVGLSRSQIHRKLQKINGKSITQFIREIRLQEAHRLLEEEVGTASEIAYRVGFSSPTYFNTCFHEFYGYTPGEVKNKKKEPPQYNKPSGADDTTIIPIRGKEPEIAKENKQEADDKGRRRHAAIMFTDVVGYTALMGSNEDRAIEVLHKNREIHTELIEKYKGILIKEMGDGMLVSFNLASDAVRCAIEIQNACKKQAIPLKIGIHEGEMIFAGSDVLGDSVNIASRLQEDNASGCITISESVYRDIKNKPTIKTEFVKEKRFKNVDESIKVYTIIYGDISNDNNIISYISQPDKKRNIDYRAKKLLFATTFVLILFFVLTAIWYLNRDSKIEWAKGQALVEIEQHLNANNYSDAYHVALKAEKYNSRDPKLINFMSDASSYISIVTDPPGADIYRKVFNNPESEWKFHGNSPIEGIRLPRIFFRWKMEKEGYETVNAVSITKIDTLYRKLDEKGSLPPGMVRVIGGNTKAGIALPDFFIDKYEVTNQQFKAFVNAGGYQKQAYWKNDFTKDGRKLNWEEAMDEFHDNSGRPGPSTWLAGDYPDGQDNYPVSGISWYEAAAYAEFMEKQLPTTHHWITATGFDLPSHGSFPTVISPFSNFNDIEPDLVGNFQGISSYGVCDMAGNVKEWCWNETNVGHITRGGAWNDATYLSEEESQLPSFDRSNKNGFRCVKYVDRNKIPEEIFQAQEIKEYRNYYNEKPVSDDVFEVFMNQFSYDSVELDTNIYEIDDSFDDWTLEKITFNAAYGNERIIAFLYLPKNVLPPYQTVIYFPGGGVLRGGSIEDNHRHLYKRLEFMIKNGRAVLSPVYFGTWERSDPDIREIYYPNESHAHTEFTIKLIKDFSRSIDYLESRSDIDCNKLAYYGHSWGGRLGPTILAIEKRINVGILVAGGLPEKEKARPEVDVINFISRVKTPVLMLNGKYDNDFILEKSVIPMYDLLGTQEDDKVLKLYNTDHFVPKNELIKETLYWFDKYLGPVETKTLTKEY